MKQQRQNKSSTKTQKSIRPRQLWMVLGVMALVPLIAAGVAAYRDHLGTLSFGEYRESVFLDLAQVRARKKAAALEYLKTQRQQGLQAADKPQLQRAFADMLGQFRQNALGSLKHGELELEWDNIYIENLANFYDVLLVDSQGNIFHSIKQEKDYLKNINDPMFARSGLPDGIKSANAAPDQERLAFVDFEYYEPSGEQSAFYITAIRDGETLLGSMVLQLSMNRVANILTEREGLGRTGEVYLVNRNNTMLTPSRFINTSPAAFLQVETSAVKEAFSRGGGHRITTDYRGRKVFSSFETFRFEDSVWAILAEKDEGEIITDYYRENAKQLFTRLSERLAARRPAFFQTNLGKITAQGSSRRIKADLQEVQKAGSEETVFTTGVATCTAFAAYMPGRFAYLSHITPTDSAYSPSWATSILLGENHTDLLTKTMERMLWFDVYPFERTQLVFGVFATHDKSLPGILEKLIAQGMELSQIKAVVLPDSPPISVELSPGKKLGIIHIQGEKPGQRLMFSLDDAPTIEQVLKEILAI